MDNQSLRDLQLVQLEIAKEIKRVCEALQIRYWLDGGTMLGAVRHHGFIPWDDDLDIGMLREDYDRFVKEAPSLFSDAFFLQTWDTDPNYGMPFSKVRKNGTVFLEEGTQNVAMHHGIFVDIFPFDVFPGEEADIKSQKRSFYLLRRVVLAKYHYQPWRTEEHTVKRAVKWAAYAGAGFLALFVSKEKLKKKWLSLGEKFNDKPYPYRYSQACVYSFGLVRIPRECTEGELIAVPFEDDTFTIPKDYDRYLTSLYGDYMTPPPEEKRYNRHHPLELKF